MKKTAIIGAGVSGLSLAYYLKKSGADFVVFEKGNKPGGVAGSIVENQYVIETGPNSLLDSEPSLMDLINELQLPIQRPNKMARRRFVYYQGALQKVPLDPLSFLFTSLLSFQGKLKALAERNFKPEVRSSAESIFNFGERHFGSELTERLLRPMVVGVFGGDAKKLNVLECFPKLKTWEAEYGSIIRAQFDSRRKKAKLFGFPGGLGDLTGALKKSVETHLRLNTPVTRVIKTQDGYLLDGKTEPLGTFDQVVFCSSWQDIVTMAPEFLPPGFKVQDIAPVISLSMAFKGDVGFKGFGVLVHPDEKKKTLGILSPSQIFGGRAPQGHTLLTFIMGGVFYPEILNWSDLEVEKAALTDLEAITGKTQTPAGPKWLFRWPKGITQYNLGHPYQEAASFLCQNEGLFLNSQALGGVSVPDCIRKSKSLAARLSNSISH